MRLLQNQTRRPAFWFGIALLAGVLLPSIVRAAMAGASATAGAAAEGFGGGHSDPFSTILLELAVIILAAAFGRWMAGRFRQPSVLGELVIGMVIGNIGYWLGKPFFILVMHMDRVNQIFAQLWSTGANVTEVVRSVFTAAEMEAGQVGDKMLEIVTGPEAELVVIMGFAIWLFSNLGVILLLFMVGLESSVDEMLKVGRQAMLVAVAGVVAPFALGLGVGMWLLPDHGFPVHLFLAATLCATSVGITARVFKDLLKLDTTEARVILGAAVIDDVLGLVILAIVVGVVQTGAFVWQDMVRISLLASAFLLAILMFGDWIVRRGVWLFSQLDRNNAKVLFSLPFAFILAWIADLIGLATIVGAFAAGLILSEEHFVRYTDRDLSARDAIAPVEALFAPIFFVLMGMQVNLATFTETGTFFLAFAFTVAAIGGKLVSGVLAGKGMDRLSVGIGMIPRGEVGLIFASVGKGLGVVNDEVFSAVVIMVVVTTMIAPVALRWSLFRHPQTEPDGAAQA